MSQNWINALLVSQIVLSVVIVVAVLMQNRAEGLGRVFGGGGEVFRQRRGLENFLYYGTIVASVGYIVLSTVIVKYTAVS